MDQNASNHSQVAFIWLIGHLWSQRAISLKYNQLDTTMKSKEKND